MQRISETLLIQHVVLHLHRQGAAEEQWRRSGSNRAPASMPVTPLADGAAHGQHAAGAHEHATDGMRQKILGVDEPLDAKLARQDGIQERADNYAGQRQNAEIDEQQVLWGSGRNAVSPIGLMKV